MEQPPEHEQVRMPTARGQGWILLAEAAEPAEQMGIAAQLGELAHLREVRLQTGEEAMDGHSIVSGGIGKSPDAGVKDLLQYMVGQSRR